MPKLILKEKGNEEEQSFDFNREKISIGRGEINSLVLESNGVSRQHAEIMPDGKDYYLIDLGSGNGTILNGNKIPKNEKYILKHNDMITVEKFDIKFQVIDEMLNQSFNDITDSDILEVKLLKKVLRALDRETIPSLEVLNGSSEGKKCFITEDIEEITIGRDPMLEFPIEEYVISRQHAKIVKKWGGIIVKDLDSKNGVYVNNRKVSEEFLHDGDRIALGTIVLMYRNPREISMDEISKNIVETKNAETPTRTTEEKPESEEQQSKEPVVEPLEEEEEVSYTGKALPDEEQKKLVEKHKKMQYPTPHSKKQRIKFSAIELSMIGLGVLVFLFGIIMVVNLIFT